eukprot:7303300-Alexandrium_andersonii.AAC.1
MGGLGGGMPSLEGAGVSFIAEGGWGGNAPGPPPLVPADGISAPMEGLGSTANATGGSRREDRS